MVTRSGHAKVMDFGLAKNLGIGEGIDPEISSSFTKEGVALGTLTYMSPEQIEGKVLDRRSDIFSFGIVFYELITGIHPFRKASHTETLTAILTQDPPPLSDTRKELPHNLPFIIRKALTKPVDERYQTMRELQADLDRELSALAAPPQKSSGLKKWGIGLGSLFLVVLLLIGGYWLGPFNSEPVQPSVLEVSRFTTDAGLTWQPAVSPDGKFVAYSSDRDGGDNFDIYVQHISGG
jgi:serine/threonine protein kinase